MHGDSPNSYLRFTIEMPAAGRADLNLRTDQFRAWVDTKPTPPRALKSMRLGKGPYTIVLAFDRQQATTPLVVRIGGDAN